MLTKLIHLSLNNRVLVVLLSVALMAMGLYVTTKMPVDVFPDFTAPTVTILTEAHGMAPTEVETLITFPIETAMNGASGVRRVRSATAVGFSVVWVEFDWGTDILADRQIVAEKLGLVRGNLPPDIEPPIMAPQASAMGEVLFLAIRSDKHSLFDLRTMADTTIRRRLLGVEGVAQVTPIGGDVKQYQVVLSPSKLQAYNISANEVAEALRETNQNATAGVMVDGGQEFLVQGLGRVQQLEQIADTVVTVRKEVPIRVGQLGVVQIGAALKRGTGSAMGKPSVNLGITKQPHVNTLELTQRLDQTIDEIQATLPAGITIQRNIFRQANFIETAVRNVEGALRDGSILVMVIVLLFLGNLRASLITLVAIPMSLLTTMIVLKSMGASINTMTLGGMAIAIGALVDDAIVDVENVFRRLRENHHLPAEERRSAISVVFHASVEIRNSIFFATIIVILVFTPLFFLSGVEGRLLMPLALTYIVALLASLGVAVTITPALCLLLLPTSKAVLHEKESLVMRLSKRVYRPILNWVIDRPHKVGLAAAGMLVLALCCIPYMGRSFLPEFNEGSFTLGSNTLPGTNLAEANELGRQMEEVLLSHSEVVAVGRQQGRAELSEHAIGVEGAETEVSIDMDKPLEMGLPKRTKGELLAALRNDFAKIPGLIVQIGQPISHRIDHMLSGVRSQIAVKIYGEDLDALRGQADALRQRLAAIPGIADLQIEKQVLAPQIKVRVDYAAAAQYGLPAPQVLATLQSLVEGEKITQIVEGGRRFALVVKLPESARSIEGLSQILIETPTGRIPLSKVASIEDGDGPNQISRDDGKRRIVLSANASGRALSEIVADIRKNVAETKLPEGYFITLGGQFQAQEEASRLVGLLSIVSLALMFVVLYSRYKSTTLSALIMVNIPLALVGAVIGLWLSGQPLSVAALVGFITLAGISVRNGILKVSHYINLMRFEGEAFDTKMIVRGSLERLSPVLMTALVTAFALAPLLFEAERPGTEVLHPVAVVIFSGLISSTLLDTFLTPAMFWLFGRKDAERLMDDKDAEAL